MNKEAETIKIYKSQEMALELLLQVKKICEKHQIKYTLLFSSLWGAVEYKGFVPWTAVSQIGLLYDDFIRLKTICEREFKDSEYYVADYKNSYQFNEIYFSVAKRSKVHLPKDRKRDEVYYDYRINVFPILYAGNTKRELREFVKVYTKLNRIIHTQKSPPDTIGLGNIKKKIIQINRYRKKTSNDFDNLIKYGTQHVEATKYVYIPEMSKIDNMVCSADTYRNVVECIFEGEKFSIIKDAKEWLIRHYSIKEMEDIKKRPVNQAVLEGPEILRRVQLVGMDILIEFDRICRQHNIKYILAAGTLLGAVRHKGFIPWDDDVDIFMLYDEWLRFASVAEVEIEKEKYFIRTQDTDKDNNLLFYQIKRNGTMFCKAGRDKYDSHPGIFIDIFPFFNGFSSRILHRLQYSLCKFFKTMTWAHMGAESERKTIKRWYYMLLRKVSNKASSKYFYKIASCVKHKSNRLTFLYTKRNPYNKVFNKRESFENLTEVEFEGHKFFAPSNYIEILEYSYSKDYDRYPSVSARVAKHLPAMIDVSNLHEL